MHGVSWIWRGCHTASTSSSELLPVRIVPSVALIRVEASWDETGALRGILDPTMGLEPSRSVAWQSDRFGRPLDLYCRVRSDTSKPPTPRYGLDKEKMAKRGKDRAG